MNGRTILSLLAVTSLVLPAPGAFTSSLDGVAAEIDARREELGPVVGKPTKQHKSLDRSDAALQRDADSVADDFKTLGKVAKLLGRAFPGDGDLDLVLEAAQEDLTVRLLDNRAVVLGDVGDLPDAGARNRALKAVGKADLLLTRATETTTRARAASLLRRSCLKIDRLARKLDVNLKPPEVELDPPGEVVAEVFMEDTNTTSASYGLEISPRDQLGRVSAWYFGHAN